MADSNYLTFSQRNNLVPLPEPMKLGELSDGSRRDIWNESDKFLQAVSYQNATTAERLLLSEVEELMVYVLGHIWEKPEDEIRAVSKKPVFVSVREHFRAMVFSGDFNIVLDLLEMILNEGSRVSSGHFNHFADRIEKVFERHRAAYRLVFIKEHRCYQFFPQSSEEEGQAIQQAVETVQDGGMQGAAVHLCEAAKVINRGDEKGFADAVRESIHAVESVARTIDKGASQTLTPALNSLKEAGLIKHEDLRVAFAKLYGYTNDEKGVRHSLAFDKNAPDVSEDEALFMLGACASFSAYLVRKYLQISPVTHDEKGK